MSVVSLGFGTQKVIMANDGIEKVLHSLESLSYLKVENGNCVKLEFSSVEKSITIQH